MRDDRCITSTTPSLIIYSLSSSDLSVLCVSVVYLKKSPRDPEVGPRGVIYPNDRVGCNHLTLAATPTERSINRCAQAQQHQRRRLGDRDNSHVVDIHIEGLVVRLVEEELEPRGNNVIGCPRVWSEYL